jgi:hypothetical protein
MQNTDKGFQCCSNKQTTTSIGSSRMFGTPQAAEVDAIPIAAETNVNKAADHIKSIAISRFQASTTDILSPTAKAAFKLESKLRAKKRTITDGASANDSTADGQSKQAAQSVTLESKSKIESIASTALVCV